MAKKFPGVILIALLLASYISIKRAANIPAQQSFSTATLILPTPQRTSTVFAALTETQTSVPMMTAATSCTNAAILLRDVTIPDHSQVNAGEVFTKTWEFQNTGTCTWSHYILKFTSGDEMNAPHSTPMPAAEPKQKVQISLELTAPTADGSYAGYFALYDENGGLIPIGTEKEFWVKFRVGNYVAVATASGAYLTPSGDCIHSQNVNYVSDVIALINAARANAGLQTVTLNAQMATFAQSHAEDMAFNNVLSHDGSSGSFGERMAGYSMTYGEQIGGEILAIGTPQNAMDQWRSDEHWDYVLGAHYTQIGVGYAYNSCSDYGGYFTVDFR